MHYCLQQPDTQISELIELTIVAGEIGDQAVDVCQGANPIMLCRVEVGVIGQGVGLAGIL